MPTKNNPVYTGGVRGSTVTRDGKIYPKGVAKQKSTNNNSKIRNALKNNTPIFEIPSRPPEYLPCFVYGTLRSGLRNEGFFPFDVDRKKAELPNTNLLAVLGSNYPYPAIVEGDGVTVGELVTVKENIFRRTLNDLDRLEGYQGEGTVNLYLRRITNVLVDNKEVRAYVYILDPKSPYQVQTEQLSTGNWAEVYEKLEKQKEKEDLAQICLFSIDTIKIAKNILKKDSSSPLTPTIERAVSKLIQDKQNITELTYRVLSFIDDEDQEDSIALLDRTLKKLNSVYTFATTED